MLIIMFSFCHSHAQVSENLSRLVDFYKNADKECYTQLIQQSMDKLNAWILTNKDKEWVDEYFTFELNDYLLKPSTVNLKEEKKVFILSTYINWLKFRDTPSLHFEDYLEIDSTRTFMVACIDNDWHVKGITDLGEVGMYVETTKQKNKGCCIWVNLDVIHSYKGRNSLIRAYKKHPEFKNADAVLFIQNEKPMCISSCFGFVMDNELVIWDFFNERVIEKTEYLRKNAYLEPRGDKKWDDYLQDMDSFYKEKMMYNTVRDSSVFMNGYKTRDKLSETEKRFFGQTPSEKMRISLKEERR